MEKIKIGVITTISKTMDWFLVPTMRHFANNGYDVTLISDMEEGFIERNSDFAKCIDFKMKRGISVQELFGCTKRLTKLFKEEKFDVIYYMTPNAAMYASRAGKKAGIKIRVYNQCGIRYVTFNGIKRKIFKLVEKITCKNSTHVKSQSPKNMQFAIDEGLVKKKDISVVGIGGTIGVEIDKCLGFDHDEAKRELKRKYGIPEDSFVYGYVGRINADKGTNELIEAFKQVEQAKKDAYLMIVGMYDDQNPITDENYDYCKSDERIVLTGNVPTSEVYRHMSVFDVMVHPTYREGFGKVIQEAMGVGIPIITTDVPGPSEVIENNVSGILCRVKDACDLAEKMNLLYERDDLRRAYAEAGFIRATKYFDRPVMINNILEDMNKIVAEKTN